MRRLEIDVLALRLASQAGVPITLSAGKADLTRWVEDGHEIGNHTWDHPCLDKCSPDGQIEQVTRGHEALLGIGIHPRFFAYPNGNLSPVTARAIQELNYTAGLAFDHRSTNLKRSPDSLSRLRVSADASSERLESILSGAHSGVFFMARALRIRRN